MKKSQLNIDQLPDDVLLEIFEYFGYDELFNSMKVSERWKILILNSSRLMKRIVLFVRPINIEALMTEEVGIQHRNLMIHTHVARNTDEVITFESKFKTFVENFKENVKYTEMIFFCSRFFFTIIAPMKNLTHLHLNASRPLKLFDEKYLQVSLPKLTFLGIKDATRLLKNLKEHNIENLKIIDVYSDEMSQNINNFLKTCSKLRIIRFDGFIPHLNDVESYNFQLSSLGILIQGQTVTDSTSVLQLIEQQKDTLEILRIIGFNTKDFVEFVINDMNLKIFIVDLSKMISDFDDMGANKSIKIMEIHTVARTRKQMLNVIGRCQGVEDLKIHSNTNLLFRSWLCSAAHTMSNLRSLYIDSLLEIFLPQDLNIMSLEILTVTKLGNDEQLLAWIQLITRCPNLKKIAVKSWNQEFVPILPDETTNVLFLRKNNLQFILISLPELEEIEILGGFPMTNELVDVLVDSTKFSKLRKFTFESKMSIELRLMLKKLYSTKLQTVVLKPSETKRAAKRKWSDN